jgi:parallel beta-helix repeat protein
MMKRVWRFLTFLIIGALLATVISLATFGSQALAEEPRTWYVDDDLQDCPDANFTKIQDAVNAASPGDTIIVCPGTYTENIDVNKDHLTIRSEEGAETTIVQAVNSDDHVFEIAGDYVNITGFTVIGATGHYIAGIYLYYADYCNIINNNILDNNLGIYLCYSRNDSVTNNVFKNDGILIFGYNTPSHYNTHTMEGNTINGKPLYYYKNTNGIRVPEDAGEVILASCSDMTIENINVSYSTVGIELAYTTDSKILHNVISNNMVGITLDWSSNNILTSNTVTLNNGGVSLFYSADNVISDNYVFQNMRKTGAAIGISISGSSSERNRITNNSVTSNEDCGIVITQCNRNMIDNNTITSNGDFGIRMDYGNWNNVQDNVIRFNPRGISIIQSNNNTIQGNIVCDSNAHGIFLWLSSNNNTLTHNTACDNSLGIYLADSANNNLIYLNDFINNTYNVVSSDSANIWKSPEKITYTYKGKTFTSYLGNYWDDYPGSDADGDGIGDTPYPIDSDEDDYPLMEPFENYSQYGDVSGNGTISAYDASLILQHLVGLITLTSEQQEIADVSDNGAISAYDAALILQYTVGLITKFPVETIDAPSLNPQTENKLLAEAIEQLEVVSLDKEQQQVLEQLKHLLTQQKPRPTYISLLQNYPNPFNPETWIPYQLAEDVDVSITIYDVSGKLVRILRLGQKSSGFYMTKSTSACWDGRDELGQKVASGVYFYTLQAGDFRATRKMIILK